MAAFTLRAVKLAIVSGAAVPLIGYTGKLSATSPDDGENTPTMIKACEIPMYDVKKVEEVADTSRGNDENQSNFVKSQITTARIFASDAYSQISNVYNTVKTNSEIGIEHTRASLDYIQTNPGEVPRVTFISVATMGGFILGYRRSIFRKLLYASIAGVSSSALCYPTVAVELSSAMREDAITLWRDNVGWPLSTEPENKSSSTASKRKTSSLNLTIAEPLKGDPGQGNEEDKDLYSNRSDNKPILTSNEKS